MDKESKYKIIGNLRLIGLTAAFYFLYYIVFHNSREILISIIIGIATVPFNMLITGFLMNEILNRREKYREKKQINMLIGIFYNEVGTEVLDIFVKGDMCIDKIREQCIIKKDFKEKDYERIMELFEKNEFCVEIEQVDLNKLKDILNKKTDIIIQLIANPMLKDNECFTNAVVSILHLRDELNTRYQDEFIRYKYEKDHITEDINFAYKLLAGIWINYIEHLGNYYPKMFTKALINSPFDNRDLKTKDEEYLKKQI